MQSWSRVYCSLAKVRAACVWCYWARGAEMPAPGSGRGLTPGTAAALPLPVLPGLLRQRGARAGAGKGPAGE